MRELQSDKFVELITRQCKLESGESILTTKEVAKACSIPTQKAYDLLELSSRAEKVGYRTDKDGFQSLDYYGDRPPKSASLCWEFGDERAKNGGFREGAGRPTGIKTVQINARIKVSDKQLMADKGYTVRQVIEWAISRIPSKKDKQDES